MYRPISHRMSLVLIASVAMATMGCSTYRHTVPGYCVGDGWQESRTDKEPINFLRLRQDPPDAYRLGPRDTLGIYIEGVLGDKEEPPPVHFPEEGENLPPAIGYPMPIREDGTISLPLVDPIDIQGLTLAEAEEKIRQTYIDKEILKPDRDRIIVTLMRPRTYHVLVVREDESADNLNANSPDRLAQMLTLMTQKKGMTHAIELKAYENDVLHALSETGGLPGFDAKNEVIILRGGFIDPQQQEELSQYAADPANHPELFARPNVTRIPLRIGPNDPLIQLNEQDVILNTGDVVFVQSRETEVFYTGGLLEGGQWPLPRDYDVTVLQAMAIAGGNVTGAPGSTDGAFLNSGGAGQVLPPTRIIVTREMCGETVPIEIDLKRAMLDPAERIRIQPGDFIVLEYKPCEFIVNLIASNLRLNYFINQF